MNILNETYIFYADIYFLQNFIIKVVVLYLSLFINKQHSVIMTGKGILKICLASFAGTILEIMGLWSGYSYNILVLFIHMFEIPFMVCLVLGKKRKQIGKVIITGYFFVMLINGVVEFLWNWFGKNLSFVFVLLFACGIVIAGICIWKHYTKMQKGIFQIEICHQKKRMATYGFYDSGNRLIDTYTGKGVHIVSQKIFQTLGLEEEATVLLPYQALGNEMGIIEVKYVDEMMIEGEQQRIQLRKCPLGVTKDNLFEGKQYQIILNEEVF